MKKSVLPNRIRRIMGKPPSFNINRIFTDFCARKNGKMTVKELIRELVEYDMNQEIEICLYTSVNNPEEMVIYKDVVDKNGNPLCQVSRKITYIGLERDKKTICIS